MAKRLEAFADSRGRMYPTPREAVKADIADLFAQHGPAIMGQVSESILANRDVIEDAFADYDKLTTPQGDDA